MDSVIWNQAQAGQLNHHIDWSRRVSADQHAASTKLEFEALGFTPDDFNDKVILDFGCGSRLRSKYFHGAFIIALDPLAMEYLVSVAECDLMEANELLCIDGEKYTDLLAGRADLVLCRDMLDQCKEPDTVIYNLSRYAKVGGVILLSFNVRKTPDTCHPHILDETHIDEQLTKLGLIYGLKIYHPPHSHNIERRITILLTKDGANE